MPWIDHLITLPVVLPLLTAALLIFIDERRHELKFWINAIGVLAILVVGVFFVWAMDVGIYSGDTGVYLAANWQAPFGIALVMDRFSAMMLLLTSIVAAATLCFSYRRWSRVGVHFHSLFQFLLMGMNGALITGDLFNLFVFFEVMLAATYGLLLHGKNAPRVRAGMQYIALNLVASFFFLIGITLIYNAAGTLNMADLAARIAILNDSDRVLFETGAAVLAVAFLTKSGIWPLGFWIPITYGSAVPPVAAMLTLVTKVGVYVIYRLWLIVFAADAGESTGFGGTLLFIAGFITVTYAAVGLLASQDARRVASYSAILSSGTLIALLGFNDASIVSAALFYLVSSALAVSAFMLLIELTERIYSPMSQMLAITMELFASEDNTRVTPGVVIPAAMAILGLSFVICALVITGMPPLSGFIAKFGIIATIFDSSNHFTGPDYFTLAFVAMILISGMCAIIAMMRLGVRIFWSTSHSTSPRLQVSEASPILVLLALCVVLTVLAGSVRGYTDRAGKDLFLGNHYIEQVLEHQAVPAPIKGDH